MPDHDWDPFEGAVPHKRDAFRAFAVGKWLPKHKLAGAAGLAGLIAWMGLPFLGLTNVNWLGFAAAMGSGFWIALTLDTDFPEDDPSRTTVNPLQQTAAQVASHADWGLSLIQPATRLTIATDTAPGKIPVDRLRTPALKAMRRKGRGNLLSERQLADLAQIDLKRKLRKPQPVLLVDRRIYPLTQDVRPLVMPSPVVAMPVQVQAVFRWQHEDVPFWTGIGAFRGDVRNPATQGGRDRRSDVHTLAAIFAFPLARDTGLDVSLRAALPVLDRRDPQLDDQTFNRIFHIRMEKGDDLGLYRTLTPAAQTKLLDLFAANGAEMAIRGNVTFVRLLFTAPMSEDRREAGRAAAEWHAKLLALAGELVRLKRYLD
jgi:hypothetical protein